jgi:flagellar protein FlbD
MIKLTRINGEEFVLNAELIQFIESRPDTFITLTTDERMIVQESVDEVIRRSLAHARAVRCIPGLTP